MRNERMKIRKLRHHDFILLTQLKVIYFSMGPRKCGKQKFIFVASVRLEFCSWTNALTHKHTHTMTN